MKKLKISALIMATIMTCSIVITGCGKNDTKSSAEVSSNKTELSGTLKLYAGSYTPSKATADNPNPPTYLDTMVKDYQKLHPKVKIELIPNTNQTSTAFDQWKFTQFASGNIPDIIYNNPQLANNEATSKKWYIALDDYMKKPNKYVDGNVKWEDVLADGAYNANIAGDNKHYNLSLDAIDTAIFYNKDIFTKAGITDVPKTWDEFLADCKKIKDAGYIPFGFAMGADGRDYTDWFDRQFVDMAYSKKAEELKALSGSIAGSTEYTLTQEQLVRAIKNGKIATKDSEYQQTWKLYKEFSQYWEPGFGGVKSADLTKLFTTGKVAMYEGTSGDVKNINEKLKPSFKWGTFTAIPTVGDAKETGRIGIIGAFANYNITNATKERGTTDLSVDFLQYLSAPKNCGPMINELGYFVPMVKNVEIPEALKVFVPSVSRRAPLIGGFVSRLTPQFGDEYFKVYQGYLLGSITLDQAMTKSQALMNQAADQLITQNKWDIK